MRYKSELEVMKALGIESGSWRNLSKDKVIGLATMMPDMDKEVALKIIEQLPEFTRFALQVLDVMEKRHESSLNHNDLSQQQVHRAFQEVRDVLKGELEKDLSWEQRTHIYDLLVETSDREFAKDSENKQFIDGLFNKVTKLGAFTIVAVLVYVGVRAAVQGEGWSVPQLPDA